MSNSNKQTPLLGRDTKWDDVDGAILHVINFVPLAQIKKGKVYNDTKHLPLATLKVKSKELPTSVLLPIAHKLDFQHLWQIFKERGVAKNEEVNVVWSTHDYKYKLTRWLRFCMPRLIVRVNHKGAYDLIHSPNSHPELVGTSRYRKKAPIVELKPDVMD